MKACFRLWKPTSAKPDAKAKQRIVKRIRRGMVRVLAEANLPPWHTPHSLRHTYGSLMVSSGASLAYVQQKLGHASICMTVDTYGSWLPKSDVAAVNRVFGQAAFGDGGSKLVADDVAQTVGAS